ncbi:MAG: hypothetical protein NTW58_07820, partial [Actinobacteria bacterium]|nr:hypothetical protein [Actinomycetota bacterium]
NRPWVLVLAIAVVAVLIAVCWWIITRKAPPGDRRLSLRADPLPPECRGLELYHTVKATKKIFDLALLEKIVLTGLISVIFAQYLLPDDVRSARVLAFVAIFVVVNAVVSQWLARRSRTGRSVVVVLAGMFAVNFGIVFAMDYLERVVRVIDVRPSLPLMLFFVFLFTVITVLYDRYRTVFTARRLLERAAATETGAPAAGLE